MRTHSWLLSTGQAAELIGCSRQHVVDLCEAGALTCQTTGRHRRIPREEVDAYRGGRKPTSQRPEVLRSLWLNRAVAGNLARDPESVLAVARRNLARFREIHAGGAAMPWLDEWQRIIDAGPEAVMRALTAETPHARDLRQNSPFPGVLSDDERRAILDAFRRYRRTHLAA